MNAPKPMMTVTGAVGGEDRAGQLTPVAPSESSALLAMIERAARDPSIDIAKLEKLLNMAERTRLAAAEQAFNEALGLAQHEMRPVATDLANSQTKSRYASYVAIDRAVRDIYTKHGFSISFNTGETPLPDHIRVLAYVSNKGFSRTYHADMPADGKGAKGGDVMTKTHAAGSAYTYGQRYLLRMIFNIAVGTFDDDGNAAGDRDEKITPEQVDDLHRRLREVSGKDFDTSLGRFLNACKIQSLADLPASRYQRAVDAIEAKRPPM
jgi:hypothetical protein